MKTRFVTGGSFIGAILACLLWMVEWRTLLRFDFAWTREAGFESLFWGLTAYGVLLYFLVGSIVGAVVGFVASVGAERAGRHLRFRSFLVPALLGLPFYLRLLILINREYLPGRFSPASIAGNGALGIASLFLLAVFFWLLVRHVSGAGGGLRKVVNVSFGAMWAAALVLVIAAAAVWNAQKLSLETRDSANESRPNVLLILLETTRADHIGCYGYERDTSPNIDRLGAEGVVFEQYYTVAPFSGPSKATLATGLFPHNTGVRSMPQRIRDDVTTLAEVFRANGYRTAGFASGLFMDAQFNYHKGYMTYESLGRPYDLFHFTTALRGLELSLHRYTPWYKTKEERVFVVDATRVVPRVLDWIDAREGAPFYCLLEFNEPHVDYVPAPPFDKKFTDPDMGYKLRDDILTGRVQRYDYAYGFDELEYTDEEVAQTIALYDGEIAYVDWAIGNVVEGLRERGILDNTIVIVTADHGENFGEHGTYFAHTHLYEQSIHVPMVIHYPPKLEPRRIKSLVHEADVFPTLMELSGLDYDGPTDGVSMLRKLENDASDYPIFAEDDIVRDVRLMEYPNFRAYLPGVAGKWRMVREKDWKLIYIPGAAKGQYELYNIPNDPLESENLVEAEPEIAERLKYLLDEWLTLDVRGDRDLDPALIRAKEKELRALGYIQ